MSEKSYLPVPVKKDEGQAGESGTGNRGPGNSRTNDGTKSGACGKPGGGSTGKAAGGVDNTKRKEKAGKNNDPAAKKAPTSRKVEPLAPPMPKPQRTGSRILASAMAASDALTSMLR